MAYETLQLQARAAYVQIRVEHRVAGADVRRCACFKNCTKPVSSWLTSAQTCSIHIIGARTCPDCGEFVRRSSGSNAAGLRSPFGAFSESCNMYSSESFWRVRIGSIFVGVPWLSGPALHNDKGVLTRFGILVGSDGISTGTICTDAISIGMA